MIILSTHLDDAVWSCHGALRGATVITVCAGIPPEHAGPTQFDTRAGFASGADAMRARRAEDTAAAALAHFTPVHLDCLDAGYPARLTSGGDIASAVSDVLHSVADDALVLGPVGLRHPDHHAVSAAFRRVVAELNLNAWLYEDLPYAYVWPETLAPALAGVGEETITRPCSAEKRVAVETYASQAKGCHLDAILAPERYHHLNGTLRP